YLAAFVPARAANSPAAIGGGRPRSPRHRSGADRAGGSCGMHSRDPFTESDRRDRPGHSNDQEYPTTGTRPVGHKRGCELLISSPRFTARTAPNWRGQKEAEGSSDEQRAVPVVEIGYRRRGGPF